MKKLFLLLITFMAFTLSSVSQQNYILQQKKFVIHTSLGDMKGILYNETPKHRDNFVKLVKSGFYNGTLFHRVIPGFMIQGGDPESKNVKQGDRVGSGGPGYTIPAEFNPKLTHNQGALAAARLGGPSNPKKESSGSQFYIVEPIKGAHNLDNDYTVFGEITEGLDVVTKIANVKRDQNDRPLTDIQMTIKMIE